MAWREVLDKNEDKLGSNWMACGAVELCIWFNFHYFKCENSLFGQKLIINFEIYDIFDETFLLFQSDSCAWAVVYHR